MFLCVLTLDSRQQGLTHRADTITDTVINKVKLYVKMTINQVADCKAVSSRPLLDEIQQGRMNRLLFPFCSPALSAPVKHLCGCETKNA
jgi:hypothetical protein